MLRRERDPLQDWGPTLERRLVVAQDQEIYKAILKDFRLLYQHQRPDSELKVSFRILLPVAMSFGERF